MEDPDGSLLTNLEAACREALAPACDILNDKLRAGEVLNGQSFKITNEAGIVQALLPMKDALQLALKQAGQAHSVYDHYRFPLA